MSSALYLSDCMCDDVNDANKVFQTLFTFANIIRHCLHYFMTDTDSLWSCVIEMTHSGVEAEWSDVMCSWALMRLNVHTTVGWPASRQYHHNWQLHQWNTSWTSWRITLSTSSVSSKHTTTWCTTMAHCRLTTDIILPSWSAVTHICLSMSLSRQWALLICLL